VTELGDLRTEWERRGARFVNGHAIVTARGMNSFAFRRAVYERMGLALPPMPDISRPTPGVGYQAARYGR
jgi:hypothetical protein